MTRRQLRHAATKGVALAPVGEGQRNSRGRCNGIYSAFAASGSVGCVGSGIGSGIWTRGMSG